VNTSKYDIEIRKNMKRDQRSPAYRDLQRRAIEERSQLETRLRERNEAIDRLKKKLVEAGFAPDIVAKLAA
jgi:predicted nuclease with TOPRIM domain